MDSIDSSINGIFKLNFDSLKIENKSASGWVIRDSNGIIKVVVIRHICNVSIIIVEYVTLRDNMLATKKYGFLSLEIEVTQK